MAASVIYTFVFLMPNLTRVQLYSYGSIAGSQCVCYLHALFISLCGRVELWYNRWHYRYPQFTDFTSKVITYRESAGYQHDTVGFYKNIKD